MMPEASSNQPSRDRYQRRQKSPRHAAGHDDELIELLKNSMMKLRSTNVSNYGCGG